MRRNEEGRAAEGENYLKEIAMRRCRVECSGDVNEIEALNTLLRNLRDVSESRQLVLRIDTIIKLLLFPFTKFSFNLGAITLKVNLNVKKSCRIIKVQRE